MGLEKQERDKGSLTLILTITADPALPILFAREDTSFNVLDQSSRALGLELQSGIDPTN